MNLFIDNEAEAKNSEREMLLNSGRKIITTLTHSEDGRNLLHVFGETEKLIKMEKINRDVGGHSQDKRAQFIPSDIDIL